MAVNASAQNVSAKSQEKQNMQESQTMPPQLRAARLGKQRIVKTIILTVTLLFLFVPLVSMFLFTIRHPLSGKWSFDPWIAIFTGDGSALGADLSTLWSGLGASLALCVVTVLSTNPIWLCFAYVVLVMPFAFRALAVGLNSIDVKTLCEASRSLGASWPRVFFRVLIPNLWQSILSASFISIAVVLGEYTVASLLGRMNLQVALYQLGQSNSQISTAMSLLALLFGVILLVALDLISSAMRRNKEGDNS